MMNSVTASKMRFQVDKVPLKTWLLLVEVRERVPKNTGPFFRTQ